MTTTLEQTLEERVARALSQWMNGTRLPAPPNWERLQESTRRAYREQAQAAIAAHQDHNREVIDRIRSLLHLCRPAHATYQIEALLDKMEEVTTPNATATPEAGEQ